jgi:anti-sigma factor RsiW
VAIATKATRRHDGLVIAVLLLAVLVLGAVGWSWRPQADGALMRRALEARATLLQAQTLIPVNGVAEARRYVPALSLAAGAQVVAPDLDSLGFRLIALRFGEGGAELFYTGRDNEELTLCLHPSAGKPRLDRFQRGKLGLVLWQDEHLAMVAAAELPAARLQHLASLAYSGLQP